MISKYMRKRGEITREMQRQKERQSARDRERERGDLHLLRVTAQLHSLLLCLSLTPHAVSRIDISLRLRSFCSVYFSSSSSFFSSFVLFWFLIFGMFLTWSPQTCSPCGCQVKKQQQQRRQMLYRGKRGKTYAHLHVWLSAFAWTEQQYGSVIHGCAGDVFLLIFAQRCLSRPNFLHLSVNFTGVAGQQVHVGFPELQLFDQIY